MNIKDFHSQVNKQGLARANRWVVRVYPPTGLTATGRALSNALSQGGNRINVNLPGLDAIDAVTERIGNIGVDLGPVQIENNLAIPTLGYALTGMGEKLKAINLFTSSCTLPSRDISNEEWVEWGESRQLGVKHTHTDVSINYYCSEDLRERKFFEQWQDVVFNPATKQFGYYKDYISYIEIIKYDASWSKPTAVYRLNEAYPSNISALEMNHSENPSPLELTITFKYRNYEIIGPNRFDKFKLENLF